MARPKQKAWVKPAIEQLDILDLFSRDDMIALINRHLGSGSDVRARGLIVDLRNVLGLYRASLHVRAKPTEGSVRAALVGIRSATVGMLQKLATADDESRDRIATAANLDSDWRTQNPFDCPIGSFARNLDLFLAWTNEAIEATGRSLAGAHYLDCEREAVSGLLKIWVKAHHHHRPKPKFPPSTKAFAPFVADALSPVAAHYPEARSSSLTSIIAEILSMASTETVPQFAKGEG